MPTIASLLSVLFRIGMGVVTPSMENIGLVSSSSQINIDGVNGLFGVWESIGYFTYVMHMFVLCWLCYYLTSNFWTLPKLSTLFYVIKTTAIDSQGHLIEYGYGNVDVGYIRANYHINTNPDPTLQKLTMKFSLSGVLGKTALVFVLALFNVWLALCSVVLLLIGELSLSFDFTSYLNENIEILGYRTTLISLTERMVAGLGPSTIATPNVRL